jgi:hypothetical protein
MAKHIWLVRRYQRETLATAMVAYNVARVVGKLAIPEACCFVGYTLESIRQSGRGKAGGRPLDFTPDPDGPDTITRMWNVVHRTGHRYSRGKNAGNYQVAGRLMLAQRLRLACGGLGGELMLGALIRALEEGGEWQPLHDYLEERAGVAGYEPVREALANGLPPLLEK